MNKMRKYVTEIYMKWTVHDFFIKLLMGTGLRGVFKGKDNCILYPFYIFHYSYCFFKIYQSCSWLSASIFTRRQAIMKYTLWERLKTFSSEEGMMEMDLAKMA